MLRLQDREFNDAGATKTRLQREGDALLQQPGIVKCEELSKTEKGSEHVDGEWEGNGRIRQ
jgi:hypothetical protein